MLPRRRRPTTPVTPAPLVLAEVPAPAPIDRDPSFVASLGQRQRVLRHARVLGGVHLQANAAGKIRIADAVAAAGVRVPRRLGTWDEPEDVPWADLPGRVVVKSDHGSFSNGVLPVERVPGGWHFLTRTEVHTEEVLTGRLRDQLERGRIRGPFFAEELVDGPTPDALPDDVKVYVFHDEAHIVMLRRVHGHLRKGAFAYRVVDRHGAEHPYHDRAPDPSIPLPERIEPFLEAASLVGAMCRAPFTRVDFYDSADGPVFGEVTPSPGGPQWFGAEADRVMGEAWERAEARLWAETASGRSLVPWVEGPQE